MERREFRKAQTPVNRPGPGLPMVRSTTRPSALRLDAAGTKSNRGRQPDQLAIPSLGVACRFRLTPRGIQLTLQLLDTLRIEVLSKQGARLGE